MTPDEYIERLAHALHDLMEEYASLLFCLKTYGLDDSRSAGEVDPVDLAELLEGCRRRILTAGVDASELWDKLPIALQPHHATPVAFGDKLAASYSEHALGLFRSTRWILEQGRIVINVPAAPHIHAEGELDATLLHNLLTSYINEAKDTIESLNLRIACELRPIARLALVEVPKADGFSKSDQQSPDRQNTNERMMDILTENPSAKDWGQRKWAAELNTSAPMIAKTDAWKLIMNDRKNETFRRCAQLTQKAMDSRRNLDS